MAATAECIVEVMAAEGTTIDPGEVIVTTGGQQVIDLVCKTLIDPGDVIVAEAPTYPGAVPTFSAYQADVEQIEMDADGMPIDELEEKLDGCGAGPAPEVHLHDPQLPEPRRRDDVAARRRRLVEVARERELLCSRTTRTGCCATRASRCRRCTRSTRVGGGARGRLGPRHLPRHVLEDPLARVCGSAGRSRRGPCSRS